MTRPPIHRIINALVLASAVAAWPTYIAIPFAISAGPVALWVVAIGFLVALAHALLLGLPLYLRLSRRDIPRPGIAVLAGGLIGALPVTILIVVSEWQNAEALGLAVMPAILFGFCGALGGAVFNFVITRSRDLE